VPGTAVYFYFLNHISVGINLFRGMGWNVSNELHHFLSGSCARIAAGTLLMPITVIKTRFEGSKGSKNTILGTGREILNSQGWRGLFSGLLPTTLRDAPYAGIYVTFYRGFKSYLYTPFVPSFFINGISGALAATCATSATQPFDLVKTRMQLEPAKYTTFHKTINLILKENGISGFFSGLGPRLIRKPLQSMITWAIYEELLQNNAHDVSKR
jgi:solute carrier family 25 protein 38